MGTRTFTVVFTDMEAYTAAVARADREGLRRLISQHAELVSPVVRQYGGRVVKNLGDSFMCLFESATDAVRASLALQERVESDSSIRIRIGMTTGDVEEIGDDAFGDAVNQASRILNKAPAGEIWLGPGTMVCMNAAEIPWESAGRFELKGLPGAIELYRAVPEGRCWLPQPVYAAAKSGRLVRIRRGEPIDTRRMPSNPVLLFEGFTPGSGDLTEAMGRLPVLDPSNFFLATHHISPVDRFMWTDANRGLVIGTPLAVDRAIVDAKRITSQVSGTNTILLDGGSGADFDLVIAGLALPAVPLADVVQSYTYDLMADGRWTSHAEQPVIRIDVTPDGPHVVVTTAGVVVDGRRRGLNEVVPLRHGSRIEAAGRQHTYVKLADSYFGAVLGSTDMRLGVLAGDTAEVGRDPSHPGLKLPEGRGQSNIRWCSGPKAARARAGGFTLDRALAGRRQASVALDGSTLRLQPLHDRCATYLLEQGGSRLQRITGATTVSIGDAMVVGTTVVMISDPED
ncbi:MAG: adenylate/guanylate cyclase domain-containing protein [Alphaproteobacteria bacterium]|nr:adenylate/guanylate cyclase domain-containing protein [Alphaproteobacteria bacterium]